MTQPKELVPRSWPSQASLMPSRAPSQLPSKSMTGIHGHAFDFFRGRAAPNLAGHFSSNVWECLVLQLGQQHSLVHHASVAVGALGYFLTSGTGCSMTSKGAKDHYNLALTHYGQAITGLRSYIEEATDHRDEEVTLVVLVSCLLFVCFEMLRGDQSSVISHLVKGLKILFAQYKSSTCLSVTKRPVILGNDFPNNFDNLVDVFVRLDADSTMFGRRSTYLCTSCRCCCVGSEVKITHSFSSVAEARSHLDLLTSSTFALRGNILKLTEQAIASQQSDSDLLFTSEGKDWARKYCNLYARSRSIDLSVSSEGRELAAKQIELTTAFEAWNATLTCLKVDPHGLSITMLRIQHFFAWFIVSTLRDTSEMACDRFHTVFAEMLLLAEEYMERTKPAASLCGFALESGVLRSLYIIGLKCRDSRIRWRAVELLRTATVQEGLWCGRVFAAYLQRVIDAEEGTARKLQPDLPRDRALSYDMVPEEARFRDVVLASDDTRPMIGRIVCAQPMHMGCLDMRFVEDTFQLRGV